MPKETTIFTGQQIKAKLTDVTWIGDPSPCARVTLTIRELDEAAWKSLPAVLYRQFKIMQEPDGPKAVKFPEIEFDNQHVKFFSSGVSTKESFAAMGTTIEGFTLNRQQAKGDASGEDVLLKISVMTDLNDSSVAWMRRAFETELLIEVEQAEDPQAELFDKSETTERLEPKRGKKAAANDGDESVQ